MDAVRLIKATRHALAECTSVPEIIAEVWQAQALAEAIGGHLAVSGPQSVRVEALWLSEVGVRDCPAPLATAGLRAAGLSEIQDPRGALGDLGELLGAAGVALVGVAVFAEEEGLYWQCMEAIDAVDESGDRITGILRRLELQAHGGAA